MSKAFIVLGMHRSATSLTAGGLNSMGVDIGSYILPPDIGNEKGHFENEEFMYLNELMLRAAGGSWDDPPPEEKILEMGPMFKYEITHLIERSKSDLWGWKDPRTTLTIKNYMPYLENPHFIVNFRNPMDVAKSLKARDGMSIASGLDLARVYNERLLSFLSEEPFNTETV